MPGAVVWFLGMQLHLWVVRPRVSPQPYSAQNCRDPWRGCMEGKG